MKKLFVISLVCIAVTTIQASLHEWNTDSQYNDYQLSTAIGDINKNQSANQSWMYGTWKYNSAYGPIQLVVTSAKLTVISNGVRVYSGTYEYSPGRGSEEWGMIRYDKGTKMIIVNSIKKLLYYDVGEPMRKVK